MKFLKSSEYVLLGHPDRLCDVIVETLTMIIWNIDGWKGRSAFEALYTGKTFILGGEFKTSLTNKQFTKIASYVIKRILFRQTSSKIKINYIWQKQSSEIYQGSLRGFGDNTIAYGYYNHETKTNKTPAHHHLAKIATILTQNHNKKLPDGKLLYIADLQKDNLFLSIEQGLNNQPEWKKYFSNPQTITTFHKSGANADSGVVGRKLIAERHGNGIVHGGGAFCGKDFTKGDKSLKLIGDYLAQVIGQKRQQDITVQLLAIYGQEQINLVCQETTINQENYPLITDWKQNIEQWYQQFSPVKPSDVLNTADLALLEKYLVKMTKKPLKSHIW